MSEQNPNSGTTSAKAITTKLETAMERLERTVHDLEEKAGQPLVGAHAGRHSGGGWIAEDEPSETGRSRKMLGVRYVDGYKPRSTFKSFGEFLQSGFRAKFQGGDDYMEWCRRHAKTFDFGNAKAIQGLTTTTGAEGGFLVLPEFAKDIMDRVYDNDLLSRTDSYTLTSGNRMEFPKADETSRAHGSRAGGIRGYWVGEGDTITASEPKFQTVDCKLRKVAVIVYLTEELLNDNAYALEQWVTRKVSEELNFLVGDAIINGNGGPQPLGILNSNCLVTVAKEAGQTATTIVAANVLKMYGRRLSTSRPSDLVWLINQDCEQSLFQMTLGANNWVVYQPPGGLSASPYATLMGRPVIATEFNKTLGTAGDIILADMKQYVTCTKGDIQQAVSTHVEFLTDQTALRFTMRIGGLPYDDTPLTPYQGSNTQSAFVVVAARS